MTLFSVDKSNDNRKNPEPNVNDQVLNRLAHNTNQFTYKSEGNTNYQRVIHKNALTLSYDDQNRVISVSGFIPQLANYPVTIDAIYGYDVFVDILGITPPTT